MDIEELAAQVRSNAKTLEALAAEGVEQKKRVDTLIEGIRLLSQARQHRDDVTQLNQRVETLFQEILNEVRNSKS